MIRLNFSWTMARVSKVCNTVAAKYPTGIRELVKERE